MDWRAYRGRRRGALPPYIRNRCTAAARSRKQDEGCVRQDGMEAHGEVTTERGDRFRCLSNSCYPASIPVIPAGGRRSAANNFAQFSSGAVIAPTISRCITQ